MRADERRFDKAPGVRTRPLPDLGYLLVFTPERPGMHWLNPSAWLIFELCDGTSEDEILAEYAAARSPAETVASARDELRADLDALMQGGVVRAVPSTNQRGERP